MLESCDNCGGPLIRGECHGCGKGSGFTFVLVLGLALVIVAIAKGCGGHASAQEPPYVPTGRTPWDEQSTAKLADTLLVRMIVWTNPNTGRETYVEHCRNAPTGCAERMRLWAELFTSAGALYNIDPELLAALAIRESGLNPFRVGARGEGGLMQINPCRRDLPADVRRFVGVCHPTEAEERISQRYRDTCSGFRAVCQRPIVLYAAKLLASCFQRCEYVGPALGAYNTGSCVENEYALRIMRELATIRGHRELNGGHDYVYWDVGMAHWTGDEPIGVPAAVARGRHPR